MNTRDLGLDAAGKGDAPRYKHDENYRRRVGKIKFDGVRGLVRRGQKLVKTYSR